MDDIASTKVGGLLHLQECYQPSTKVPDNLFSLPGEKLLIIDRILVSETHRWFSSIL